MHPTNDAVVVLCTVPDEATAVRVSRGLVESRLAACVLRTGAARSVYVWKGELCDESEIQLVIKTHRDRLDELGRFVAANHPYETPELIALPAVAGSAGYLAFVDEGTRPL